MKNVVCLLGVATVVDSLPTNVSSSSSLTYIQIQCYDSECGQGCNGGPIPQETCVGSTDQGAAQLKCLNTTHLEEKLWTNPDCSGASASTSAIEINSCLLSSIGEYYENLCCEDNDSRQICYGPNEKISSESVYIVDKVVASLPTDVSSSSSLTYIQIQCYDSECGQGCNGGPIPQETCVGSTDQGAAQLKCLNTTHLEEKLWTNSDCSGASASTSAIEISSCLLSSTGEYYENLCCEDNDSRQICYGPNEKKSETVYHVDTPKFTLADVLV